MPIMVAIPDECKGLGERHMGVDGIGGMSRAPRCRRRAVDYAQVDARSGRGRRPLKATRTSGSWPPWIWMRRPW